LENHYDIVSLDYI